MDESKDNDPLCRVRTARSISLTGQPRPPRSGVTAAASTGAYGDSHGEEWRYGPTWKTPIATSARCEQGSRIERVKSWLGSTKSPPQEDPAAAKSGESSPLRSEIRSSNDVVTKAEEPSAVAGLGLWLAGSAMGLNLLSFSFVRDEIAERMDKESDKVSIEIRDMVRALQAFLARQLGAPKADAVAYGILKLVFEGGTLIRNGAFTNAQLADARQYLGHVFLLMIDHHELSFVRDPELLSEALSAMLVTFEEMFRPHMASKDHARLFGSFQEVVAHSTIRALYMDAGHAEELGAIVSVLRTLYMQDRLPK